MRGILQAKYIVFFVWMMIIPAAIAYIGGWDRTLDYLFFLKAFSIALLSTVVYYILVRRFDERKPR